MLFPRLLLWSFPLFHSFTYESTIFQLFRMLFLSSHLYLFFSSTIFTYESSIFQLFRMLFLSSHLYLFFSSSIFYIRIFYFPAFSYAFSLFTSLSFLLFYYFYIRIFYIHAYSYVFTLISSFAYPFPHAATSKITFPDKILLKHTRLPSCLLYKKDTKLPTLCLVQLYSLYKTSFRINPAYYPDISFPLHESDTLVSSCNTKGIQELTHYPIHAPLS